MFIVTPRMVAGCSETKAMTPPRWRNTNVFLLIGLLCLTAALSFKGYQEFKKKTLSFSQLPELKAEVAEELSPSQVLIPSLGINLPVFPAKASGEIWEIFEEGASYLLGSGVPGQKGNVVIYGHNKNKLFGPIRWLGIGEEIKVINKKGEEFVYKIAEIKTVSPQMIEVLFPTEDATLTLYTCTGFLDSQRFIVVAKLQPEQK